MSGEELKKKLDSLGLSQAEIARKLGVIPQSMTQYFKADDVRTGFLEKLCRVFDKDMSFFYGYSTDNEDTVSTMKESIQQLQHENTLLKEEITRLKNSKLPTKDSKVYNLWMKFMEVTQEMSELYKEEKGV